MSETQRLNDEIKSLEEASRLETNQIERDRIGRILDRAIFRFVVAFSNAHPSMDRVSARIR